MSASHSDEPFTLGPDLDVAELAARLAAQGCVQIDGFLADNGAERLRDELVGRSDWRRVINGTERVFEAPAQVYQEMETSERTRIESAVHAAATHGFQFLYDTIRVPDYAATRAADASLLAGFARFMSEPATLDFLGRVGDASGLVFADAQATRYRKGDFLTRHDDLVAGKSRSFAYVLGLTPGWQPEWGGLLLLNDVSGGPARAIVPRFNALTLFNVGQPHSVSYVAPYAGDDRISVTGWLRTVLP